jgi:putative ABC transport system permease protein
MSYALAILWHERNRFLPGVLAVTFSTLLIALQLGLLLGMFSVVSIPIDRGRADVWVGYPGVPSADLGLPVPAAWEARLAAQPGVERTETYVEGFLFWGKRHGGAEMCLVVGSHLDDGALGAIEELTADLRARLTEAGSVVVDESDLPQLDLRGVGDVAEVAGCRVRLVGVVRGVKGLAGPYIFCSVQTARMLLRLADDQATFLLGRCRRPADAAMVVERMRAYPDLSAFTRDELSGQSRLHWLTKTKAGIALGCAALLGLLVGAAVTSQTLYAATQASLREYAVLEALGIPTVHMAGLVLRQALGVGLFGIALALPLTTALARAFEELGAKAQLPPILLIFAAVVNLLMALLSGLIALRSLRRVEPADLLR